MKISEVTRRKIIDTLRLEKVRWHGRLEELDFLSRLFDLTKLPSKNGRFYDATGDIWKHRVMNNDWDDYWIFHDSRFNLLRGNDDDFLRFLCEMVHPVVRPDADDVSRLVKKFNKYLKVDGWEIVEKTRISEAPVFSARPILIGADYSLDTAKKVAFSLDADYITQQIIRMEVAVDSDPELAIGTAKEFVETVCKTILEELRLSYKKNEDFPKLVQLTCKALKLAPDDIPERAKAAKTIKILLSNLATVAHGLAELRNPYGTGHGKLAKSKGLRARHARLAVGAASALAVFLFETNRERGIAD